ncbi:hypothetical protein FBU30_010541 [Linnemannia zychae]|nr:hypothetical protein FBU30_010541 [Linnemannia zychae]
MATEPCFQSFRRPNGQREILQIEAHFHSPSGRFIVLWDDIREVFPRAANVRYNAVIITQARHSYQPLEPRCIWCQPEKVLDIVVEEEPNYRSPQPSEEYSHIGRWIISTTHLPPESVYSSPDKSTTEISSSKSASNPIHGNGSTSASSVYSGATGENFQPFMAPTETDGSIKNDSDDECIALLSIQDNDERTFVSLRSKNHGLLQSSQIEGVEDFEATGIGRVDRSTRVLESQKPQALSESNLVTTSNDFPTAQSDSGYNSLLHDLQNASGRTPKQQLVQMILEVNQGNKKAKLNLEICIRKAREALSATQGNAKAQNSISDLYRFGRGVQKDYSKAMIWYKKAADQGHAIAQSNIGYLYQHGLGVQQDYSLATTWYKKAAEQGYAFAQNNIGCLYDNGHGVQRDYSLAMAWHEKAAEQGHAIAQNNIGGLYQYGHGVQQDYSLAMIWYKKAAAYGDSFAQNNIGNLYRHGQGVLQDYTLAMTWYKKAADHGHAIAQYNIGYLYQHGLGTQRNRAIAKMWYQKAAVQGHDLANHILKNWVPFSLLEGGKD